MSALSVETFVLLFPNQEWTSTRADSQLDSVVSQLRPNISFTQHVSKQNLQTLSSHSAPINNHIRGFPYVPDLEWNSLCDNISRSYVPANVTRQANLPPADYTLIAVAPWIDSECTRAYMASARQAPVRAFLFYLPENGTAPPPPVHSTAWSLDDGGQWTTANPFPVYAVSSDVGAQIIYELSLYSGNMTSVPYGHEITGLPGNDPRGYVRMYTEITLTNSSVLPSLWVFALIIIAVLLTMLALTSGAMHFLQQYRRRSLKRRVASGEVNLEALCIARLTVPLELILQLPLLTYNCEQPPNHSNSSTRLPVIEEISKEDITINVHSSLPHTQSTCAICLDDFQSGVTQVRQLPCEHIFHPECIGLFLCNSSSLCPMCKSGVLPLGYVPTINKSMVRRERDIRKRRSSVTIVDEESAHNPMNYEDWLEETSSSTQSTVVNSSAPSRVLDNPVLLRLQPFNMTSAIPASELNNSVLGNEVRDIRQSRRDIALQRIQELTAAQTFPEDSETAEAYQSRWRNRLKRAFPGFT